MEPTSTHSTKTLGIVSLVLGIISLIISLVFFISIPLGIAALVFGIIGIRRNAGKGLAVAGVVTGAVAVLVGLLVMVIFLAVPALQRNQNDTETKNRVATAVSGITSFRTDNSGRLPTLTEFESSEFQSKYLPYVYDLPSYRVGYTCDGNRKDGAFYVKDTLGNGLTYCLDS